MKIDRRICNICRRNFALHPETCEFLHYNYIDEYTDLCDDCLKKIEKFIEIDKKLKSPPKDRAKRWQQ